jgi:hypothetical protein
MCPRDFRLKFDPVAPQAHAAAGHLFGPAPFTLGLQRIDPALSGLNKGDLLLRQRTIGAGIKPAEPASDQAALGSSARWHAFPCRGARRLLREQSRRRRHRAGGWSAGRHAPAGSRSARRPSSSGTVTTTPAPKGSGGRAAIRPEYRLLFSSPARRMRAPSGSQNPSVRNRQRFSACICLARWQRRLAILPFTGLPSVLSPSAVCYRPRVLDHPMLSTPLGPECAIATRPSCDFFQRPAVAS